MKMGAEALDKFRGKYVPLVNKTAYANFEKFVYAGGKLKDN